MSKLVYSGISDLVGLGGPHARLDPLERGTANTAFTAHAAAGRVYALSEDSAPFEITVSADGAVASKGYERFDGNLRHAVTAHPKYDPASEELLLIGYDLTSADRDVTYSVVDAKGTVVRSVDIKLLEGKAMMHDWAVTKTRGVLLDCPLRFQPEAMLTSDDGQVFQFDESGAVRIGVFPRAMSNQDEIVWIDAAPPSNDRAGGSDGAPISPDDDGSEAHAAHAFFSFHTISAWDDEDGRVVLTAMRMPSFKMDFELSEVNRNTVVYQWTIDVDERRVVSSRPIFETPCEFPVINEAYVGKRHRYAYVALQGPRLFNGMAKLDLVAGCEVSRITWPSDSLESGEFVFAPRIGSIDEDDGYLLGIVSDTRDKTSTLIVLDARDIAAGPAARIALPHRVPHGLHSKWLSREALDVHLACQRHEHPGPTKAKPSSHLDVEAFWSRVTALTSETPTQDRSSDQSTAHAAMLDTREVTRNATRQVGMLATKGMLTLVDADPHPPGNSRRRSGVL